MPYIHSRFPLFTYLRTNGDQMGGTVKTWQSRDAESTASCFSTLQKYKERKTHKTFEQIQIPENTQNSGRGRKWHQANMSSGLYRQKGTKINFSEKVTVTTYLLFVTDTTDGVCVKKIANFYRFNAKNWHFWQILREKVAFFTDLTQKIGVFQCKFYSPKFLTV